MTYQIENDAFKDHGKILEILQSESQRGGVLLGAAMLDDCLLKLLKGFMVDSAAHEVERLLEGGLSAPLGSFSARTLIAYCLGLISEDEFKDIEIIRDIRNKFAHNLLEISFDNQSIQDKCKNLTASNIIPSNIEFDASSRFLIAVAMLSSRIAIRALVVHRQKREKAKPFALLKHVNADGSSQSS